MKEVNSKQAKENDKKLFESCMIMNEVTTWVRVQFFFKNCTQTHVVTHYLYDILLIIISTA